MLAWVLGIIHVTLPQIRRAGEEVLAMWTKFFCLSTGQAEKGEPP